MQLLQNTLTQPVARLGFCADGRTLVAGGDGGFDVWDLATGSNVFFATEKRKHSIFALVPDPPGRWVYHSASRDGCVLYALDTGGMLRLPGLDHHVLELAVTPDGRRLAVSRGVMGRNRLECWDIGEAGQFRLVRSVPGPLWTVSFRGLSYHPSGNLVASLEHQAVREYQWDAPHAIVVRDAVTGAPQVAFGELEDRFSIRTTFTPDGERLIVWNNEQFSVWDLREGKPVAQVRRPGRANINGLAVHPSGQFLLTGAGDRRARLWDARSFRQTRVFEWQIGKLHSVAFSPDGMLAAAGGELGQVILWDVDA